MTNLREESPLYQKGKVSPRATEGAASVVHFTPALNRRLVLRCAIMYYAKHSTQTKSKPMEVEVVIPLDVEPYERILDVDARIDHSPTTRHYPGHTETEIMGVTWSDYDPVDEEDRKDAVLFFEDHEDRIREIAFMEVRKVEMRREGTPMGI